MAQRWKAVLGAGALALGVLLGSAVLHGPTLEGAPAPDAKIVRAGRFELAGKDGKLRAELTPSGGLVLFDGAGKARARLTVAEAGTAALEFLADDGKSARAALRVADDGASSLTLSNAQGQPRAKLNVEAQGATDLRFYGGNRRVRMGFTASDQGPSGLFLYDLKGTPCAALEVAADDSAHFAFYDRAGKQCADFGLSKEGGPTLTMSDEGGNRRVTVSPLGCSMQYGDEKNTSHLGLREDGSLALRLVCQGNRAELCAGKDGTWLELASQTHKGSIRLATMSDGSSDLTLTDQEGKYRGGFYLWKTGEVGLKLCDGPTAPRIRFRLDKQPHLEFYDQQGRLRSRMELADDGTPVLEVPKGADELPKARF